MLAWTILLLLLASAYLLAVAPALDLYRQRGSTLSDRQMLARHLSVAAREIPELRAEAARLRTAATNVRITLDGASDAIVLANLQTRIEDLAASAGTTIASTEVLPAENQGEYRRIGLRMALSGEYDAIVKLLEALESTAPPLVVSDLQIHARAQPTGLPSGSHLDAGFDVFGFRPAEASSPRAQ